MLLGKDLSAFNTLLTRAALLNADIAILYRRNVGYDLPSNGKMTTSVHDGEVVGTETGTVHWDVARVLLSEVRPNPSDDERVRIWYRATTAYLQYVHEFAEVEPNLKFGLDLFPKDAPLLLYAGTMHESYAAPRIQNSTAALNAPPQNSSARPNLQVIPGQGKTVGSMASELKEAERYFRETLAADPALVEARIRLGHVLGLRDRHAEAARELETAVNTPLPDALRYIAMILLGRERVILGERDAARVQFELAAKLYPGAQSPRLGLSQIARDAGSQSAALDALQILQVPPITVRREDPLWEYERLHTPGAAEMIGRLRWWLAQ